MKSDEPTNLGLSEKAHGYLKRLHEEGHFAEMRDAYKFGIALALSHEIVPPDLPSPRSNIFGVASIDPDKSIYSAIVALMDTNDEPVYKWAERLAEWGVEELFKRSQKGQIDFVRIIEESKSKLEKN